MIQERSIVTISDNSGAKVGRVFRVLGATRKRYAEIGDIVVISVQKAEPRKSVKKKAILRAVVVRQTKAFRRTDGSYIRFDDNAFILIDKDKKVPLANRVFGPVPR
jgi:large subunit ribosomal protein L14